MRFIILFLFFLNLSFANILSLKEAFNLKEYSDEQGVYLELKLADGIYIYDNKIQVLLNNQNLTSLLNIPKPSLKNQEKIHYNVLNLFIPNALLSKYLKTENLLEFHYQGCSDSGFCYQPQKVFLSLEKQENFFTIKALKTKNLKVEQKNRSQESLIADFLAKENVLITLLSFFGYGLLLSLTPCVLPMIPILSSLIIAKGGLTSSKKYNFFLSLVYVFSMSLAYALAGILASYLGASVQGFLQKPSILIAFALIFVLFALSMFGLFEIQMPLKFQNFLYKKTNQGKGILSIALMGFLSALIVGPCVAAPLSGALIYIANTGDLILGGLALFVMSFAMGVPLLFIGFGIALFKPGIWMQKIKLFFAFVFLAMAIWILSRILNEWIILIAFGILGVFFCVFMGIFDKENDLLAKLKKGTLIVVLAYSLILFSLGIFKQQNLIDTALSQNQKKENLNYKQLTKLDEIKNLIRTNNKIMLDFTASWCEYCKLLDNTTFKDPKVKDFLQNYTLIKIDVSENNEEQLKIMKEFQVFAPPVLIFIDNAKEFARITGFVNADEFLETLN